MQRIIFCLKKNLLFKLARFQRAVLPFLAIALLSVSSNSLAADNNNDGKTEPSQKQLRTCSDLLAQVKQTPTSYYSDFAANNSDLIRKLRDYYSRQVTPSERQLINQKMTDLHSENEMSFQVKNPRTGLYDKTQAVPVNSVVAPISHDNFAKLIKSVEPVLKLLRELLQRIYSGRPLTVDGLGLQGLHKEDATLLINTVRESIYLEPKLIAPQMKDYPFISVAGFDGAIGDPSDAKPYFYEMNLGTPSGLSNNIMLLSFLSQVDQRAYRAIQPYLAKDDTFTKLKNAIESNAKSWTKRTDGITVVVSPGKYNGAHPDVAMISKFTGWPLVQASDMYQDSHGWVRLNTGLENAHPIVTGIYGRAEESYFLQSNSDNIPMISPSNVGINQELSKKLGIELRPAAVYFYIYDENGHIIDVARDENGQPEFLQVWDQIGLDPTKIEAPSGSFLKAIHDRKLYYSAIGGRVVDDKRLFRIISELAAKSAGIDFENNEQIAQPVRSLKRDEFYKFFADPELFVVKVPDNSGGQGIVFAGLLPEEEKKDLVARVKASPSSYEIQYVAKVTTLPALNSEVATDLRMYIYLDANGKASAGENSMLLRVAKEGHLLSNTSQGGGYGISVVTHENDEFFKPVDSAKLYYDLKTIPMLHVPVSKLERVGAVFEQLVELLLIAHEQGRNSVEVREALQSLVTKIPYDLREVMSYLPTQWMWLLTYIRERSDDILAYDAENMLSVQKYVFARDSLLQRIRQYLQWMSHGSTDHAQVDAVILHYLKAHPSLKLFLSSEFTSERNRYYLSDQKRREAVQLKYFEQSVVSYYYPSDASNMTPMKLEMGVYESSSNPEIQAVIEEVKAGGGEIRMLRRGFSADAKYEQTSWEPPYFWVNLYEGSSSYLRPVIAIDLFKHNSLPALKHELEHFRFWHKLYNKHRALGLNHEEATKSAVSEALSVEEYPKSERLAVDAEIKTELQYSDHLFCDTAMGSRPNKIYQDGYVNRITYPEFEGVKNIVYKYRHRNSQDDINARNNDAKILDAALNDPHSILFFQSMIRTAFEMRRKAIETLFHARDVLRSGDERAILALDKHLDDSSISYLLHYWQSRSLVDLVIYPYGIERLSSENYTNEFLAQFDKVAKQMYGEGYNRLIFQQQQ